MKLQGLYLIADTAQLANDNIGDYIASLIKAGVSVVQFRDKTHIYHQRDADYKKQLARTIQTQCRTYHIPFIVNDDVALAVELDADGVHLGQHDMPIGEARQRLGDSKYIGASCQASAARAIQAQQDGADYVAFGAVFTSPTKPQAQRLGASDEESLQVLQAISRGIKVPICAIGGITPNNVKQVVECGVQMIAVASGISAAVDPIQTVTRYNAACCG